MKKFLIVSLVLFCCRFLNAQTLVIDKINCLVGDDEISKSELTIAYNFEKSHYVYQYEKDSIEYEITEADFSSYLTKAVEWKKIAIENKANVDKIIGSTSNFFYYVMQGKKRLWTNYSILTYDYGDTRLHNSNRSCCIQFRFVSTDDRIVLFMTDIGDGYMFFNGAKEYGRYGTEFPHFAFFNSDIDKFYYALTQEAREIVLVKYKEQEKEKNKDAYLFQ